MSLVLWKFLATWRPYFVMTAGRSSRDARPVLATNVSLVRSPADGRAEELILRLQRRTMNSRRAQSW